MNVFVVVRLAPTSLSGWMVYVYVCLRVCIQFFLRFTPVCHQKGIKMLNAIILAHQNFNDKIFLGRKGGFICMCLCEFPYLIKVWLGLLSM